jgi:hypothetical protein
MTLFRPRSFYSGLFVSATLFMIVLCAHPADAQEVSIAVGGGAVNWTMATGNPLIPGNASNIGSNNITVTATWNLQPGRTALILYAYFPNAAAALAHASTVCGTGCLDIPASAVEIRVNGGAFAPVNGTGPFGAANASRQIFNLRITGANKVGNRTDTLGFNINLSALPQLSADNYSGTLFIQAQATP